jgi:Heterokaryon incompatibility protein (HET)
MLTLLKLARNETPAFLQPRADAPENFELIRSCLTQCDRHARCNQRLDAVNAPKSLVPKRVIDISTAVDEASVKLVFGEEIDARTECRYVALSHCWGDSSTIPKTVAANLLEHQQRIEIGSLSQTFQDAIVVTQEIGVRYHWIDFLRIVQDSEEDFEECGRMHLIYSRACHGLCNSLVVLRTSEL